MGTGQLQQLEQITKLHERVTNVSKDYWMHYSNLNTWQFWVAVALLIMPLVALYFLIDRRKALLIGFFGLNIHVWFHYADIFCVMHGLVTYPYKVTPFFPASVTLDASFIPVTFMLLYQWTLNKNKNYYLYATAYSLFLSFLFKPALITFELFRIYKGLNYFYIFMIYVLVFVITKWITNLFIHFQKEMRQIDQARGADPIETTIMNSERFSIKRLFKKEKAK